MNTSKGRPRLPAALQHSNDIKLRLTDRQDAKLDSLVLITD